MIRKMSSKAEKLAALTLIAAASLGATATSAAAKSERKETPLATQQVVDRAIKRTESRVEHDKRVSILNRTVQIELGAFSEGYVHVRNMIRPIVVPLFDPKERVTTRSIREGRAALATIGEDEKGRPHLTMITPFNSVSMSILPAKPGYDRPKIEQDVLVNGETDFNLETGTGFNFAIDPQGELRQEANGAPTVVAQLQNVYKKPIAP